jgi:hypothetical protein
VDAFENANAALEFVESLVQSTHTESFPWDGVEAVSSIDNEE